MIDTIRFRIPKDPIRSAFFKLISTKVQHISPTGFVILEYMRFKPIPDNELTTQFRHIYIKETSTHLIFEFSINKMIEARKSGIRLNHNNYPLLLDIAYLKAFINDLNKIKVPIINEDTGEVIYKKMDIKLNEIELMKIDIGFNFKVKTNIALTTHLFEILHIHLGRFSSLTTEKFRGGLFHKSNYKTIKFYSKYEDLKEQLRKFNTLTNEDIKEKELLRSALDSVKDIVRFEISYKKKYLKNKGIAFININKLYKLIKEFKEEMEKIINLMQYKKDKKKQHLTIYEKYLIFLCNKHGYANAKEIFIKEKSKRTFYRVQKTLLKKGINIKSLSPEICNKLDLDFFEEDFPFYIELVPV